MSKAQAQSYQQSPHPVDATSLDLGLLLDHVNFPQKDLAMTSTLSAMQLTVKPFNHPV